MDKFGLLTMNIVLDTKFINKKVFFQDIRQWEPFCDGIFIDAFDFEKRKKINSINEVDTLLDTTYIIEYRIHKNNFFVELYRNYLSITFSKYSNIPLFMPLIPIFQKYALMSDFILTGFETSLFLDEYPNSINSILADKSSYPLYANQKNGNLYFKRYAGHKPMEEQIETFLHTLFGDNLHVFE